MRSLKVLTLLCLFSLFVVYEQTAPPARTELTVAAGLKRQTKEAYDALEIYSLNYREKLRQELKASALLFDQEIQALAIKISAAARDAQDQFAEALEDWRGRKEVLQAKLQDVKAICVAAWEATKKEVGKRIQGLRQQDDPSSPANS